MKASMYSMSVPVYNRMLNNLGAILDKAQAHATARKFDPSVLLGARLFPDMLPLTRQVQIACDSAKGSVARLAGVEPPKHEDIEATVDELKARIAKTLAYVNGFKPEQIDGSEDRDITIKQRGEDVHFKGLQHLSHVALPNFYFHVTTTYAILRHNGVELGKRDFLGSN